MLFQSGAAPGFCCSGAEGNAQGWVCWQLGAGLLLAGLCFSAFEQEGCSRLPEGAGLGEDVLHLFHV